MTENDCWEDIQRKMEGSLRLPKVEFVSTRRLKIRNLVGPGCFGIMRNAVLIVPYVSLWADLEDVS